MLHILIRVVIGLLLIVHGVAHWEIATVWESRETARSWLLGEFRALGKVLSVVALAGFILAGIAVFVGLGLWRPLAVASAVISLITMALFWDFKMTLGVIIDVGILVATLWLKWPPPELIGS